ncbi:cysteine desulfurase [Candidatus Peregrinibacteria bacterium CG_4_10_14_0_2_um_filter_38_24]|nr:MAG: cysteine desulfurase [Candidatus Peregrinibacteria bacterium CG_4_10_14_0_2_um_filter_38_24]
MQKIDPKKIKKLFPIFSKKENKNLVYLDNASTTQRPKVVIDAIKDFYETYNSNIHRGIYDLSEKATKMYEDTRKHVAKFINAKSSEEIIFTKNTTESINLLAYTLSEKILKKGNRIIVTSLEHHSNFVPWQTMANKKGFTLSVVPVTEDYTLDMKEFEKLIKEPNVKLVCISAMSNVTGTVPPIQKIIKRAHEVGALVLVDGAQSIAHEHTDVQKMNADFFVFSSHKMFGPFGVGIVYGKKKLLDKLPPFLYGGDMIKSVKETCTLFSDTPWKFEAGTPSIADVVAFDKAMTFIEKLGIENIKKCEMSLAKKAVEMLKKHKQVKIIKPKNLEESGPVISFVIEKIHPHDIAEVFNGEGVAIRAGHHCNQPLMSRLGIPATARISFSIYNTEDDIKHVDLAIKKLFKIFAK